MKFLKQELILIYEALATHLDVTRQDAVEIHELKNKIAHEIDDRHRQQQDDKRQGELAIMS